MDKIRRFVHNNIALCKIASYLYMQHTATNIYDRVNNSGGVCNSCSFWIFSLLFPNTHCIPQIVYKIKPKHSTYTMQKYVWRIVRLSRIYTMQYTIHEFLDKVHNVPPSSNWKWFNPKVFSCEHHQHTYTQSVWN